MSPNQNPEQIARDAIDAKLRSSGWAVQAKDAINFHEAEGQAVREYATDTGPADYVLFVDGKPVGVIEAKKETLGQAKKIGYDDNKVLMIGDAPGDMKAAKAVGALFFPINPGREEQSWERFHKEACDKFLNGEYAGEYEKQLIAEFDEYLPELPPWKR